MDLVFLWGNNQGNIVLKISSLHVTLKLQMGVLVDQLEGMKSPLVARHIHRGNIKVPTVSILCYTYLQDAWQTDEQRYTTTQLLCVTEM